MELVMRLFLTLIPLLLSSISHAMTDNGDGTRTFTVGGDFVDLGTIIWGHPVGVMHGDTLIAKTCEQSTNFIPMVSGISGDNIKISVCAKSIDDNGESYLTFQNSVFSGSTSHGVNITGAGNNIYNCTISNTTSNGVEVDADCEISNVIFEAIGGTDINNDLGTATTSNNFLDSDGDPLFISSSNFGLKANSPARGAASDGGDIGAYQTTETIMFIGDKRFNYFGNILGE